MPAWCIEHHTDTHSGHEAATVATMLSLVGCQRALSSLRPDSTNTRGSSPLYCVSSSNLNKQTRVRDVMSSQSIKHTYSVVQYAVTTTHKDATDNRAAAYLCAKVCKQGLV